MYLLEHNSYSIPNREIRELIENENIKFNKLEINLLNILHKAYKENDNLGIYVNKLKLIEQSTIDSLVSKRFIAFTNDILSLTIFGYNYCVNKK